MWRVVDGPDFWMCDTKKEARELIDHWTKEGLFTRTPLLTKATNAEIEEYLTQQEFPDFGRIILHYRTKEGLTQEALAKAIGVSQVTVSEWEHNNQVPSTKNLELLEDRLNFEWQS